MEHVVETESPIKIEELRMSESPVEIEELHMASRSKLHSDRIISSSQEHVGIKGLPNL